MIIERFQTLNIPPDLQQQIQNLPRPERKMGYCLGFTNKKGGVGKSSGSVNTAAVLAELGYSTLLVDLEENATSTKYSGFDPNEITFDLKAVYGREIDITQAIKPTNYGYHLLPSNQRTAIIEAALEPGKDDELLRQLLEPIKDHYHFIVIDPPPGKQKLTYNALHASDWVIIPTFADSLGYDGLNETLDFLKKVIWREHPELLSRQELRIFFLKARTTSTHADQFIEEAVTTWGDRVLPPIIPDVIDFSKSFDQRAPFINLFPTHRATDAYRALGVWLAQHVL